MKFNRFLNRFGKKGSGAHTNAMAEAVVEQTPQSSAESFARRKAVETNRQHVRGYHESGVVHSYRADAHATLTEMSQQRQQPTAAPAVDGVGAPREMRRSSSSRIDIVRPSRQGYNASLGTQSGQGRSRSVAPPARHHFTEPPSRYR